MTTQDTPIFPDVPLKDLPSDLIEVLGGNRYEVGHQDGVLSDLARRRQVWYRIRFPVGIQGEVPVILISQGGIGSDRGHTVYRHLGTAFAQLGFLAVNVGHMPSATEMEHRFDRPLDISLVIDALERVAAAAKGTPFDAEETLPLSSEFTGVEEREWLGRRIRGQQMLETPINFAASPDADHVGVIGHSFGAFAAHAVAGADHSPTMGVRNFRDPRVDATVAIAPPFAGRYGYYDKGPDNNSWKDIQIPSYVVHGDRDLPWRRQSFDRYPATGNKFLTIGANLGHGAIAGIDAPAEVQHAVDLNTALFFHTYLRNGNNREMIGTLALPEGWVTERK